MQASQTILVYDAITALTERMLLTAKAEDWDALTDLEAQCAQHMQQLKYMPQAQPQGADADAPELMRIQGILANHAQIRALVSARMEALNAMINHAQNDSKLSNAYQV